MKVCPYFINFYSLWIEVGIRDILKNLLSDCESYENLCNEKHIMHRGINEFTSVLPTFGVQFG